MRELQVRFLNRKRFNRGKTFFEQVKRRTNTDTNIDGKGNRLSTSCKLQAPICEVPRATSDK